MLGLVMHARTCSTFFRITKQQYLREELSYFVYFLHVVTHPWKLQCYSVGYGPTSPKFSEITNHQYLCKELSDFVIFLHVVVCILLDIHWSEQNMLFWAHFVRHSLSANLILRHFKLKKLENHMRYQVDFFLSLKLEKMSCCFGLWHYNIIVQSVCKIFYFWLAWLFNLNSGGPLLHIRQVSFFMLPKQ